MTITHEDLALLMSAPAPFNRAGWIFELKYDGFRILAANRGGGAELVSRRGNDFAVASPSSPRNSSNYPPSCWMPNL